MLGIAHAISVVLGIAGAALVARGATLSGQALWIPANVLWIVWCAALGDWWGLALFAIYLALAIAGVVRAARRRLEVYTTCHSWSPLWTAEDEEAYRQMPPPRTEVTQ